MEPTFGSQAYFVDRDIDMLEQVWDHLVLVRENHNATAYEDILYLLVVSDSFCLTEKFNKRSAVYLIKEHFVK